MIHIDGMSPKALESIRVKMWQFFTLARANKGIESEIKD